MGNCIGQKSPRRNKRQCYYSPSHHEQGTTTEQLLLSSVQRNVRYSQRTNVIPVEQKRFKFNERERDVVDQVGLMMGYLLSKEKDQEVLEEIKSESNNLSSSPTLSNSSFSSISFNSTSFSSEDQLILSSSSSSAYSNQCESFHPTSLPPYKRDLLPSKLISHQCRTLSSVIDDLIQQQIIRIHRRTETILIEHEQFQCIQLNEMNSSDTPAFIFDEDQNLVYVTRYAQWSDLQSVISKTNDISRRFSSCDYCSSFLSGAKWNAYFRSLIIASSTYQLMQICFGDLEQNAHLYGYISQVDSNRIRRTIVNNSKLTYSYDLEVDYADIDLVLRVNSWPKEIRAKYEQRSRLWPTNIEQLFARTCFLLRYNGNECETLSNDQCFDCEEILSVLSNSSWSYTYAAIEGQLVHLMSEGQIRFASIMWNYLNSQTQGQLPFTAFKHTLFYFFEQYSSDAFTSSDVFSQVSSFLAYLIDRVQSRSIPHYFEPNSNLFNEKISIEWISTKMTYSDLRYSSIHTLPKSAMYLYELMYLIEFQRSFVQNFPLSKRSLTQIILQTDEFALEQLSLGIKTYKQRLDCSKAIKSHRLLTLDRLYRYQEENVQIILDYLPWLRLEEPSLLLHSFWSIFIQYLNSLFDDLFYFVKIKQQRK